MTLDLFLKWVGGLSPFLLLAGGWLVNRRVTAANAAKAVAEAKLTEANVDKTAMDVQATILANTKSLLAEARTVQAEKDAVKEERIRVLTGRVGRMESRFEMLRTVMATHGVWDATALVDLRGIKPDYPAPPPIPQDHPADDD